MRRFLRAFPALCCAVFLTLWSAPTLTGQTSASLDNTKGFLFDALTFRGRTDTLQRLDVFVVVPYQHINFVRQEDKFIARYTIGITVRDSTGLTVDAAKRPRTLVEGDYSATVGATAQFDYLQTMFHVRPGTYSVEVTVYDDLAKTENTRSRKITVLPFNRFPFSLSSVMLASSIAHTAEGLTVTPHVTDDVTMLLQEEMFAFFESYSSPGMPDSVLFLYEILDDRGTVLTTGTPAGRYVGQAKQQHYLPVDLPGSMGIGTYILRVLALRPGTSLPYRRESILAASEHSLRVDNRTGYGPAGAAELDEAIRQLRYVATDKEIDFIQAGTTVEERRQRFQEFWKRLDPTQNTPRNEAYEQYYQRVEYADNTFRSYTEGWLTDMGMVYIIFGPPGNVERQAARSDGRVVEVWYYPQNRQIVFVDYSGFGDFRLASPLSSSDRYRYQQ